MLCPEGVKGLVLRLSAACLVFALAVMTPACIEAAQKTLRGEIDLHQGYDSNIDREPEDEQYESTSSVTTRVIFSRLTQRSNFSLTYAPSFVYNYKAEEERVDHSASLGYDVQLTRRLVFDLENAYVQSDDPYSYREYTAVDDGPPELSDRRGRRRYWTNRLSVSTRLEYAEESILGLGYTHYVLKNRDDAFDDFTRHSPFASLSYRLNRQWAVESNYSFIRGDFDEGDDIRTHEGDIYLFYRSSPQTRFFVHGGYLETGYETSDRAYNVYTASVGINRALSPFRSLDVDSGVSWIKRDEGSDSEAFYLRAAVDNRIERGSWRVYGESGFDERYYDGDDDEDLSRYWLAGAGIRYFLTPGITGSMGFSFREDRYFERPGSEKDMLFRGDASLRYAFWRYYEVAAGYTYTDLDADRDADSYENHRVFIRLAAGRDLLRW